MQNQEVTKTIKRHIGKILEGIDHLPSILKQGIKSQLWLLHDDLQKIKSMECEDVKRITKTER